MKKITVILLLFASAIFTACSKDAIRGNGPTATETRNVDNFNGVQSNGDITVNIIKGAVKKVEIQGYRNILDILETFVTNNTLIVKYNNRYNNIRNSNVTINITVPDLSLVATNGSGDVSINGFDNGTTLESKINGSSDIVIRNSRYNNVILDVNGSGHLKSSGLQANNADATIHGSGDIEIACQQKLKARIFGSGSVMYWGNPTLDVEISGSGKVKKQ